MEINEFFESIQKVLSSKGLSKASLNEEQIEAIKHDKGPLWILAGPGSGKTEVLVWKVLRLILVDSIDPRSIFMTTFTEKASKSMMNRILLYFNKLKKLNPELVNTDINGLRTGTLHSLCNLILAEYRFQDFQTKRLMDQIENSFFFYRYIKMSQSSRRRGPLKGPENDFWQYFFSRIPFSNWDRVNKSMTLISRISEDIIDVAKLENSSDNFLVELSTYYEQYQKALDDHDRCDFTNLQTIYLDFLNNEMGRNFIQGDENKDQPPIQYILVDEYQDTNLIQEEIYFKMVELNKLEEINLTVVGDDDQALYRFRGATVDALVNFQERIKQRFKVDTTRIQLKRNYRSHKGIVDWYNDFIHNFEEMKLKGSRAPNKERMIASKVFDEDWEPIRVIEGGTHIEAANKVALFIDSLINNPIDQKNPLVKDLSQIAILARSTKESVRNVGLYTEALNSLNIPYYNPRNRKIHETTEVLQLIGAFIEIIDQGRSELLSDDSFVFFREEIKVFLQNCRSEYENLINSEIETIKLEDYVNKSQEIIRKEKANKYLDSDFHKIFLRLINCPPFSDYLTDPTISPRYGILSAQMEAYCSVNRFPLRISETASNSLKRNLIVDFYKIFCDQMITGGLNDFEDIDYPILPGYIQIMTYHQAKGLEFPFVILLSLTLKPRVESEHRLEDLLSPYRSRNHIALDSNVRATNDLIRLFYVGQSRAKYGLIYAGSGRNQWIYSLGYDDTENKKCLKAWLNENRINVS